jgi:hypothetical protein
LWPNLVWPNLAVRPDAHREAVVGV